LKLVAVADETIIIIIKIKVIADADEKSFSSAYQRR